METFKFSDGWLFISILYCGKDTSLENLIAKADMINHSIILLDEINEGLSRLESEGLIKFEKGRIILTSSGKKFYKNNNKIFENFIDKQIRYSSIFQNLVLNNDIIFKNHYSIFDYNNAIKAYEKNFNKLFK